MTRQSPPRWLVVSAAIPLLVVPVLASTAASAAGDVSTGLWYVDTFHIPEAQAAGYDGSGVTIAVIDSPVNAHVPTLANSNLQVVEPSLCVDDSGAPLPAQSEDTSGHGYANHGTDVTSVLVGTGAGYEGQSGVVGVAPGAKVLFYATAFGSSDSGTLDCGSDPIGIEIATAKAIDSAIDAGARIISISLGVNGTPELTDAIARAHREGVVVLGALPNERVSVAGDWPSAANGVVAVQAIDAAGAPQEDPSGGPTQFAWATVAGPGVGILSQGLPGGVWTDQQLAHGTSLATPIVAGFLALVLQKYPDATGNQLIQTLIHNTGTTDHDLVRDDYVGYGIASVTHMLEVDPTQYPDENPLLTADNLPSPAESVPGGAGPTSEPGDTGDPADATPWGLIIGLGVGGLILVIAIIVVIVLVATRRSRRPAGPR